jgi:hypothetical protein
MGNKLFGVDVAGIVARNVGPGVLPVALSEPRYGARIAGNLTGGRPQIAPLSHGARGFWEDFTGDPPPGVEVLANDRKAVILGDSLPAGVVPERGWDVTIEGVTLGIVKLLNRDPAAAVYVYQCRDRQGPDGV